MARVLKQLVANDQIAGVADSDTDELYAAGTNTGLVTAASAYNGHGSAVVLSVYILPESVTAASVDPVAVISIPNGETALISDLLGHVIPPNGTLEAFAGTTNVIRVTVTGVEIS